MKNNISNRIETLISLVEQGSITADIGTDHAYLPICLIKRGICRHVYASDINRGPVLRAEKNIGREGLSDRISVYRANGLEGIERFFPDYVIIAGMGGELIRDIISVSEYTKRSCVKLILQPMTQQPLLRAWLYDNGFTVYDERLCNDGGKIYQIICVYYTGVAEGYRNIELILGKINMKNAAGSAEYAEHVKRNISIYEKIIKGKKKAGLDCIFETEILEELKASESNIRIM